MIIKKYIFIKIVVFITVFSGILLFFSLILPHYKHHCLDNWKEFYKLKKNSIDILFVGSSHARFGFRYENINETTGFNTFTLWSPGQDIRRTYYTLIEGLHYQTPQVIVLDLYNLYLNRKKMPNLGERGLYMNVDGIRFSKRKIDYIIHCYDEKYYINAFFPLFRDHGNWKNVKAIKKNWEYFSNSLMDSLYHRKRSNVLSVQFPSLTVKRLNEYRRIPRDMTPCTINNENFIYMKRIKDLSDKKNIRLIFVMVPWLKEFTETFNYKSFSGEITKMCDSLNSEYIDYNLLYDILKITSNDFVNEKTGINQHLNLSGAQKVVSHLIPCLYQKDYINKKQSSY